MYSSDTAIHFTIGDTLIQYMHVAGKEVQQKLNLNMNFTIWSKRRNIIRLC